MYEWHHKPGAHLVVVALCLIHLAVNCCDASLQTRTACRGATIADSQFKTAKLQHTVLKERYDNCQVVLNNLIIERVEDDDRDYSFLNSIEEVLGFVWIYSYKRSTLPLQGLRVVRGNELYQGKWAWHVGQADRLVTIEAYSLVEVSKGAVNFAWDSLPSLCYAFTIDWQDVLNTEAQYTASMVMDASSMSRCNSQGKNCSSQCADGCWDSGTSSCYNLTRLTCSPHCGHRCRGNSTASCCDDECAAGCTGSGPDHCLACRNYDDDGICVSQCPPLTLYDPSLFRDVPNPKAKYTSDGLICVSKCPDNRVLDGNACVPSCSSGKTANGSACVVCENGICPKVCNGSGEIPRSAAGQILDFETNSTLDRYQGCTHIQGYLKFSSISWSTIVDAARLDVFKDVKIIDGYLYTTHNNLTSTWDFLGNLEEIRGSSLYISGTAGYAVFSISSGSVLESLNLGSVKRIGGNVAIVRSSQLCYVTTINASLLIPSTSAWYNIYTKNQTVCDIEGMFCDVACDQDAGCWGAGPKQCVRCRYKKVDDTCINNISCPALTYDSGDGGCTPCHAQCIVGCTGEGAGACTSCKSYKDGPYCVAACPPTKHPSDSGACVTCSALCKGGCTGGLSVLGKGGCNACYLGQMDADGVVEAQCLDQTSDIAPTADNSAICSDRYLYREPIDSGSDHGGNWFCRSCSGTLRSDILSCLNCSAGTYQDGESTCLPCNSLCTGCTGPGSHQCGDAGACKHAQHDGRCVASCPAGTYRTPPAKLCAACHALCAACRGPAASDCSQCRFAGAADDVASACGCPDGKFFNNATDTCDECHAECRRPCTTTTEGGGGCDVCDGALASDCTQCLHVRQAGGGECVARCDAGHEAFAGVCRPVATTAPPPAEGTTTAVTEGDDRETTRGRGDAGAETVVNPAPAEAQTSTSWNWIPLAVAGGVLVVLVAAFSFMLYKRQDIIARIKPAGKDNDDEDSEEDSLYDDKDEEYVSEQRSQTGSSAPLTNDQAKERRMSLFRSGGPSKDMPNDVIVSSCDLPREQICVSPGSTVSEEILLLGNEARSPTPGREHPEVVKDANDVTTHITTRQLTPGTNGNVNGNFTVRPLIPMQVEAPPSSMRHPRKQSWRDVVPFNTQFTKSGEQGEVTTSSRKATFDRARASSSTPEPFVLLLESNGD